MFKGPQGQKRPADAIGCAVLVGRIATGEAEDDGYDNYRPKGSAGGVARNAILSPDERKQIAKAAAAARWKERRIA